MRFWGWSFAELYRRFSEWMEGDLTKVVRIVATGVCGDCGPDRSHDLLILGNGALPTSLRAAVFEAVVGAMYLDGGLEPVKRFILGTMTPYLDQAAGKNSHENYKSDLQQFAQRHLSGTPQYETLDEQGPDHSKCFEVCVVIAGQRFPGAWGPSKKEAEQEAAKRALEELRGRER